MARAATTRRPPRSWRRWPGPCWGRPGGGGAWGDRHRDARGPRPRRGDHGDGRDPRRTRPSSLPWSGSATRHARSWRRRTSHRRPSRCGPGTRPEPCSTTATTPTGPAGGPINATRRGDVPGRRQPDRAEGRFRDDPGWGLVAALEQFDPVTQQATKAAIFERGWRPRNAATTAPTPPSTRSPHHSPPPAASTWR